MNVNRSMSTNTTTTNNHNHNKSTTKPQQQQQQQQQQEQEQEQEQQAYLGQNISELHRKYMNICKILDWRSSISTILDPYPHLNTCEPCWGKSGVGPVLNRPTDAQQLMTIDAISVFHDIALVYPWHIIYLFVHDNLILIPWIISVPYIWADAANLWCFFGR